MCEAAGTWSVEPLELGRRTAHRAWFYYLSDDGSALEIAYRVWLLRSENELILVDTGPPLEEGARRGLRDIRSVDDALLEAGVRTGDIRTVVLTHMHWDHASSADRFTNARFHVQRAELDFFMGIAHDHPVTARFFSHRDMLASLVRSGRVEIVDGDHDLRPGIRLIRVGGHTPGSQIVVVACPGGCEVVAGDAIPLNRNYTDLVPNGIFVNIIDAIAGLRTVRALGPSKVYTGHDVIPSLRLPVN
jgi:glyoxylase-like metal-dependent hydrolase (beta-lactamase superfamily II)